jgi:hypothetical protein
MSINRKPNGTFVPGNISGGRPAGSRNRLTNSLLSALADDFEEHGVAAIKIMRIEKPDVYIRTLASILPKEILMQESALAEMSDDDIAETLAIIARLRARAAAANGPEEKPH